MRDVGMRSPLLIAAVLFSGCTAQHPGRLLVAIDTDYAVPEQITAIEVEVVALVDDAGTRAEYDGGTMSDRFVVTGRAGAPITGMGDARTLLPLSFMVRARHPAQRIEIVVRAIDTAGAALVSRRVVTGFLENRTLVLPIYLARACGADAVIPVSCPAGETCAEPGVCVAVEVDPSMLEEIDDVPEGGLTPNQDAGASDAGTSDSGPSDGGCEPDGGCGVFYTRVESSGTSDFTCAAASNTWMYCWGYNDNGELGRGTETPYESSALPVRTVDGVLAFATGGNHACQSSNGSQYLKCWGSDSFAQLGSGSTGSSQSYPLQSVERSFSALALGEAHTCGVSEGQVYCWGRNLYGQVNPDNVGPDAPMVIHLSSLAGVVGIAAGRRHTCALLATREVWCWGDNEFGQLGASPGAGAGPVRVQGISDAIAIDAGELHTCALTNMGTVLCWGQNEEGGVDYRKLGNSTAGEFSETPLIVQGITGADEIALGNDHACARIDGAIRCWGRNGYSELGRGVPSVAEWPVGVMGIEDAVQITAGGSHACALRADRTLWCWGRNHVGQLGVGDTSDHWAPAQVSGP
jgi:alpha-tubulin suppressor-like RCC1 family protein